MRRSVGYLLVGLFAAVSIGVFAQVETSPKPKPAPRPPTTAWSSLDSQLPITGEVRADAKGA